MKRKVACVNQTAPPIEFVSALASLRNAMVDQNLDFHEVPAPRRLAPWSAAVEFVTKEKLGQSPVGRATLVMLHDSDQVDLWGGPTRLVGQARMSIDKDQATDPLLGEAIWATLLNSLEEAGADPLAVVGTVTREISQTFGGLELQGSKLNADLRCSWTPSRNDISADFRGWSEALRINCGVMPHGVTRIGQNLG